MHVQCATCKEATAGEQAIHSSGTAAWLKGRHADCSTAQLSARSVGLCTTSSLHQLCEPVALLGSHQPGKHSLPPVACCCGNVLT